MLIEKTGDSEWMIWTVEEKTEKVEADYIIVKMNDCMFLVSYGRVSLVGGKYTVELKERDGERYAVITVE